MSLQWEGEPDEIRARALGVSLGQRVSAPRPKDPTPLPPVPPAGDTVVKMDLSRALQDELIQHCVDLRRGGERARRNCFLLLVLWAFTVTPLAVWNTIEFVSWISQK